MSMMRLKTLDAMTGIQTGGNQTELEPTPISVV